MTYENRRISLDVEIVTTLYTGMMIAGAPVGCPPKPTGSKNLKTCLPAVPRKCHEAEIYRIYYDFFATI